MIAVLGVRIKAFCGEVEPALRKVRVNTSTGAIEVFDPLRRMWTTDHAISEDDKHELRALACAIEAPRGA